MDRIRIIWSRIWNIIRDHFGEVACHSNPQIAMYAVDSMKQLSIKFLQKEELYNLQFQKEFLKPFETIFVNLRNEQEDIKDFILQCIMVMTQN